jgi:hypothetical protein
MANSSTVSAKPALIAISQGWLGGLGESSSSDPPARVSLAAVAIDP